MTTIIKPLHIVEAVLAGMPIARRDALTTWMGENVGSFDAWTPAALDAAIAAVEG